MRARRPIALATALGAGLLLGPARAHPLDHPKRDELRISSSRIQLVIDEEVQAGEKAQAARAMFDRDRDGHLDAREQAALLENLVRTAQLHQQLEVDGAPVSLLLDAGSPRAERLSDDPTSTALLAVRLTMSASWPKGSGDWRGRRKLIFSDDAPDTTGHVPVQVFCEGCEIPDASAGTFAHDPRGDWLLGVEVSPSKPLELKVKL